METKQAFWEVATRIAGEPDISERNLELFNYHKKLIEVRRKHPVLVHGEFNVMMKDEKKRVYGYKRTYGDEEIIVIINNGKEKVGIQLLVNRECRFTDLLTDRVYESHDRKVAVEIEPKNGLILFKELPRSKNTS
ncbi:MAG: alpha-glucosidase C-terminal domain-containing protein [Candidatus Heimdallarchaeota archaeon]